MDMNELSVIDKLRVLIYRYHEKGLEVFLIDPLLETDKSVWKLPQSGIESLDVPQLDFNNTGDYIHLDTIVGDDQTRHHTIAVEGDWHDIPSIRGIIKHDFKRVKTKIKEVLPDIEKGTYVAVKDIIRKVLPHEYQAIRELNDILVDRNSVGNM